jgi:RNA polymerase sigma-70 factor (ECF subfamily)
VEAAVGIEARIAQARDAWPGVAIDDDEIMRWVSARLDDDTSLDTLRIDELYLACGCAAGDVQALVHFRDRFTRAIAHAVSKMVPASMVDDGVQRVLVKLLVGSPERPPTIATYGGRGKLSTWIQVVARREASNTRRAAQAGDRAHAAFEALCDVAADGEPGAPPQLKHAYRAAFKGSFHHALAALSARERNLLRYECVDRLTLDEIANIYRVNRSTVARWRAACRERLFAMTRRAFNEQLGIVDDEFGSVVRLIESQLDVSLRRVLRRSESDDDTST